MQLQGHLEPIVFWVFHAPAYGAPLFQRVLWIRQDDFNTTPDADLFTVISQNLKTGIQCWDWATTLTAKTKAIDANNKDIAELGY